MVWAQLIAGLGGVAASAIGQHSQQKAQADQLKKILALLKQAQGQAQVAGGQALQSQQKGLKALQAGYGGALAETANAGRAQEIEAYDIGANAFGGELQNLVDSGMYSPDAIQSARRGQTAWYQRALAGIRGDVAARRAALMVGQGTAVAGQHGQIAQQYGQNAQMALGPLYAQAGALGGYAPQSQDYSQAIGYGVGALSGLDWSSLFKGGGGASMWQGKPMSPAGPYNKWQNVPGY